MPALSPTMTQGNLGAWQKKVGDEVAPGDVLVEIETDKAQMDFECQEEGFLAKILMENEKDVVVSKPIGILVENKEDVDAFKNFTLEKTEKAPAATPAAAAPKAEPSGPAAVPPVVESKKNDDRIKASPLAKSIAAEKQLPLNEIQGTGPNGRTVKADVDAYKPQSKAAPKPQVDAKAQSKPQNEYVDIPLTNVRKVIAQRLTQSKVTIPHYYLTNEINMDKVIKLRTLLNQQSGGVYKLSINDFVVKAAGLALRDVPEVNSAWMDSHIRQFKRSDIAVAVATDNGLITPIVNAVQGKGLVSISQKIKELAAKAKENKLLPHEYQGGTFTISNLGMYNISHFTAIINPPHSGILAVGSVSEKVVAVKNEPNQYKTIQVANVTLSLDHRVVDGAVGAKWLGKFCAYLEDPLKMML